MPAADPSNRPARDAGQLPLLGRWYRDGGPAPETGAEALKRALLDIRSPVYIVNFDGRPAVVASGCAELGPGFEGGEEGYPLIGFAPPLPPEHLGDPEFKQLLGIRYPYTVGAMANGITSTDMVAAAARAGMVGFFGSAGLSPEAVAAAIDRLRERLQGLSFGMNLLHTPGAPDLERRIVSLYLEKGVRLVSASAYLRLSPHLVLYRVKGIHTDAAGRIRIPNKVVAKVSRVEVASRFFAPPPEKILARLESEGRISRDEARLASKIPMADAVTAEADSGGHTDNRPAIALLSTIMAHRDEVCEKAAYPRRIPVGLAGGIGTPAAAAAAFSMGAGYVVTGSINQACVEAGVCETVRRMLAGAGQGDVTMAPSADMFEKGGRVQVLKRGTLFAMRAGRLLDCYRRHDSFDQVPEQERRTIEEKFLRRSFEAEWKATRRFFLERDPAQVERAESDPRHKMALVFRSYLGRSSIWAATGEPERKADYQIWCGPAMGAFNEWVKGSFLENMENRDVVTVAQNLLVGAAVLTRAAWLRNQGIPIPPEAARFSPMTHQALAGLMA